MLYPYSSPIILTDAIYLSYGGHTGSSTANQRSAAYFIAEKSVSEDLDTFLLPTIITGSYPCSSFQTMLLDHAYVRRIIQATFWDSDGRLTMTVAGSDRSYLYLANEDYGKIEVMGTMSPCGGCGSSTGADEVHITYEAGLPSGTSYQPDILLALTTFADIILNEIIGFGNEAPGDIGVQEFRNQQYYETRVKLLRTNFGTSARGQFIHGLLSKLRLYRRVSI